MSNKYKTDHLSAELRRFRRGVELQRAREKLAWRPPFPPRPEPMLRKALEIKGVEADDLLLRAAQAALRRGDIR